MNRSQHPSIFQVGKVDETGSAVRVYGWGLALCMAACSCHRHPIGGQVAIAEDPIRGLLGLIRHRPCDCCQSWRHDELAAILRDFQAINEIATPPSKKEDPA